MRGDGPVVAEMMEISKLGQMDTNGRIPIYPICMKAICILFQTPEIKTVALDIVLVLLPYLSVDIWKTTSSTRLLPETHFDTTKSI